ncbi:DUF6497 family protein [Aliigemmobacter aestuarii]|uniref:DUF6497 family protein n=1 Tax=Aliigemmobacter aestuarii TaxID=1445661 RepID=UPI001FE6F249|nr:DUF6497 family protein [Gemmobacter aestuarii]
MTADITPFPDLATWSVQQDGSAVLTGEDATIPVPSGQPVTLQDVIWNAPGPEGLTLRFRFVAPQIAREGGGVDFDTAAADMLDLCQNYALQRLSETGPVPNQIIISLSDVALPFGEAAPDATQFFEAFSIVDGQCVWDIY